MSRICGLKTYEVNFTFKHKLQGSLIQSYSAPSPARFSTLPVKAVVYLVGKENLAVGLYDWVDDRKLHDIVRNTQGDTQTLYQSYCLTWEMEHMHANTHCMSCSSNSLYISVEQWKQKKWWWWWWWGVGVYTAGENLAHSLALKALKATVLFNMEVLY